MKKLKFLTAAIAVGLILNSCSNNKTEEKSETTTTEVQPEVKTEPVEAAPVAVEITKKDTAKAKDFIFMVKNITEPNIDRGGYSVTKPEDEEKYIAVQIWIKNTSQSEVKLTRDDFKLFDQEDAEFVEKTAFTEHRKSPILFEHHYDPIVLKPNQTKSGWVTFTTAKTSKATKIQYDNITVKL